MSIQWFPGHMNSALKKAAEAMESVDLVIEVLDGRIPQASRNPKIEEIRKFRQRPCLKILNKSDCADPNVTQAWLNEYNQQKDVHAVALSFKNPKDVARIPSLCKKIAPHRDSALKALRMMIMGVPNVGKSTLMNALLKKRVAAVGDEPAVTKTQQRLYINDSMLIIDTPGLLWPKIEYPDDGLMLAASHSIGVNALIEEEVATFLAGILLESYPNLLAARYKLSLEALNALDAVNIIEQIAKKRALKRKGGELDLEKAANVLLQDYRSGALGRISLETPESRKKMIEKHEAEQAAKRAEEQAIADATRQAAEQKARDKRDWLAANQATNTDASPTAEE